MTGLNCGNRKIILIGSYDQLFLRPVGYHGLSNNCLLGYKFNIM
jgi:hypothetical protein